MAAEGAGPVNRPALDESTSGLFNPFVEVVEPEPRPEQRNCSGDADESAPAGPAVAVANNGEGEGRSERPPAYTEALRRPPRNLSPVEVSPLLTRHSSVSTMGERDLSNGEHVRQQRGLARAIMLWLGIGQWYSGLCIFFSFLFFSGGLVVMILSWLTLNDLKPVKLTLVSAGIIFVLLSLLWPCGWLWNQWNKTCGCSYSPFVAYTLTLSLVYTAITGALIFGVNEHYSCIHFCKNCTFHQDREPPSDEPYPCQFVQMSLWTLLTMLGLMASVLIIGFCYCCCNSSCRKERQTYDVLQ